MTALLKQAFAKAEQLPKWEQDALAAFILEEIAASQQWYREIAGQRPANANQVSQHSGTAVMSGRHPNLNQ